MNMQGEIVGINALMVSRISESAGVGLAIRGDVVEVSLKSMMETGTVSRPAIGIQIMPLGHPRQRKVVMEKYSEVDPETIPNVSGMIISTDEDLPEGLEQFDTIIQKPYMDVKTKMAFFSILWAFFFLFKWFRAS